MEQYINSTSLVKGVFRLDLVSGTRNRVLGLLILDLILKEKKWWNDYYPKILHGSKETDMCGDTNYWLSGLFMGNSTQM